jgi:hypothetical protein
MCEENHNRVNWDNFNSAVRDLQNQKWPSSLEEYLQNQNMYPISCPIPRHLTSSVVGTKQVMLAQGVSVLPFDPCVVGSIPTKFSSKYFLGS